MSNVRPFPGEYKQAGYKWVVVRQEKDVVMSHCPALHAWEVFRVRVRESYGTTHPPRECLPSITSWGTYGFTCMSQERAEARFAQLLKGP